MGYYNGNGVVTLRDSTINIKTSFYKAASAWTGYQRITTIITTFNGVEYDSTTNAELVIHPYSGWSFKEPCAYGNKTSWDWQRVNDSNLFIKRKRYERIDFRGTSSGGINTGWLKGA